MLVWLLVKIIICFMNLFFYRKYRGKLVFYEVDGVVVNMLNEFGVGGYRGLKDLELDG